MRKRLTNIAAVCFAALLALSSFARAQSPGPLRIGVLTDMNSAYSDITGKGSVVAAQLAIEDFGGKAAGRTVELLSADHQTKPDIGSAIAAEWFDRQGVAAIFDVPVSPVAFAVQTVTRQRPTRAMIITGAASSDLAGKACTPNSVHWAPDSFALAYSVAKAMTDRGGKNWFFMTTDNAAGPPLSAAATDAVLAGKGRVLGQIKFPFGTTDYSSYLLQVRSAKPNVVGLASGGNDTVNIIKGAGDFGFGQAGISTAVLGFYITDVHALGLQLAQGTMLATSFYWDQNDKSRAFAKRFFDRVGRMPTQIQASTYTGVYHYLAAVQKTGSDDAGQVIAAMKSMPVADFASDDGVVRADGQYVRPMFLARVKVPSGSRRAWDYYDIIGTVPVEDAFRSLAKSECPLVQKN